LLIRFKMIQINHKEKQEGGKHFIHTNCKDFLFIFLDISPWR